MITDKEVTLWRAAVETPARPAALEAYADWLLKHDRRRGELMRKNLDGKFSPLREGSEQARLWEAALGVPELFRDVSLDPVPTQMRRTEFDIGDAGAVLDRLSFLGVVLNFYSDANAKAVFANTVIGKIRKLWLWAQYDDYVPDVAGGYHRETTYYTKPVLEALCASPHVAKLESLTVFDGGQLGDEAARLLAKAPTLPSLRELTLMSSAVTPAGEAALRASKTLKSLRTIGIRR
jgi:hypothetical protein